MKEKEIINTCINQLEQFPPVKSIKPVHMTHLKELSIDTWVDIKTNKNKQRFAVEIKGVLKRPLPQHFAVIKNRLEKPLLIMAEYVNPSIAKDLKREGIFFIDCQGNAFIHIHDFLYIDVQGKKPDQSSAKKVTTLFQLKGLQLLTILLIEPEKLNTPIRSLQNEASISYGQAQSSLKELKEKNLIYPDKFGKYRFVSKKTIFEKWLSSYGDIYRPKLVTGSYKILPSMLETVSEILVEKMPHGQKNWALGGSIGADQLDRYYHGLGVEIFIRHELLETIKDALKLMPARETNVTLFNLFSPEVIYNEKVEPPYVVHPILLYAELLYQGGPGTREHETAQRIYSKYLRDQFDAT